jgi:hypothetical protein
MVRQQPHKQHSQFSQTKSRVEEVIAKFNQLKLVTGLSFGCQKQVGSDPCVARCCWNCPEVANSILPRELPLSAVREIDLNLIITPFIAITRMPSKSTPRMFFFHRIGASLYRFSSLP